MRGLGDLAAELAVIVLASSSAALQLAARAVARHACAAEQWAGVESDVDAALARLLQVEEVHDGLPGPVEESGNDG